VVLAIAVIGLSFTVSLYFRLADKLSGHYGGLSIVGHMKVLAMALILAAAGTLASITVVYVVMWMCVGAFQAVQWIRRQLQ